MTNSRYIENAIYQLKREFGSKGYLYFRTQSVNMATGALTYVLTPTVVQKMIMLPVNFRQKFSYDLSFVAANKNFTYGGLYDVGERGVIIDVKELPKDFQVTLDYEVIFGTTKYSIVNCELVDVKVWMLKVKTVPGEHPYRVVSLATKDKVSVTDTGE
jgi:hypothetical protein